MRPGWPPPPAGRDSHADPPVRWRRPIRPAVWCLAVVLLLGPAGPMVARSETLPPLEPLAQPSRTEQKIDGFPIQLDGESILLVHRGIAGFSAEERAQTITRRLQRVAGDVSLPVEELRIQESPDDGSLYLRLGQDLLLTINANDARAVHLTPHQAAAIAKSRISHALRRYRQDRKPRQLLRHSLYALIASAAALAISLALILTSAQLLPRIGRLIAGRSWGVWLGKAQIISAAMISSLVLKMLGLLRGLLLLLILFFWASYILRLFPWTRAFGESILGTFFASLELALAAAASYLPNLFILAIICGLCYYLLKAIKPVFSAIEAGNLVIQGFYSEWARPTYMIISLLIMALSAALAFPYLPGFESPAFRGISVFLGLLLSLGSTSVVTNVIGGIILIYTRAFRIGDHIRVGEVIGDIIEKNLLAIRICTPANQVITIPNASLLANNVINFNISSRDLRRSLALQTSLSLGYDVPWRQVHSSLIEAALITPHILAQPAPFVLQTKLADHAICYQLNAFTDAPNQMVFIYSELHQNIQDKCNERGIEILSPVYTALRDGNSSTIPAEYRASDDLPPPFRISTVASPPPQPGVVP